MPPNRGHGRPGLESDCVPAYRRALQDVVRDPIVVTDPAGIIVFWNCAAEGAYGFDRAAAVGQVAAGLLRSILPASPGEIEAAIETVGFWEGHVIHRTRDDRAVTMESRRVAWLDDAGERAGILAIDRDITSDLRDVEVRKVEGRERDRLQTQVDRSEHLDSVGQLAGGIAHDFNNSLGVIINYAGFVTRELKALEIEATDQRRWTSMRQDVREIEVAALRAARLIHQLLAFARREVVKPVALDLNDLVGSIAELLRSTVGENVTLELALGAGLPAIFADPSQLEQVLVNVASNGRDAMPTGGTLTVATAAREIDAAVAETRSDIEAGLYVELCVSDTGGGMPPDVLARAFEPFFSTKPGGRGTGLGLASVKGIVGRLGGYVEFASVLGEGTTLKAWFPPTELVPVAIGPVSHKAIAGGSETILVVEDDDVVRAAVQRILAGAGYRVVVAAGGPDALASATAHPGAIDLLLADVVMSDIPGDRLSDQLRVSRPAIRTLYMSGFAEPFVGHATGPASDLIEKPFTEEALLARVRRALS